MFWKSQASAEMRRWVTVYTVMLVASVLLFFILRSYGERIPASNGRLQEISMRAEGTGLHSSLFHVLIALIVVIVTARALGALFRRVHQPAVMGEVLAGILLGPSFLGWVVPDFANLLQHPSVTQPLGIIAQLGVLLFMFLVGLELDPGTLRDRAHSTVLIAHAGIFLPFLLGSALALRLYPTLAGPNVSFTAFALFLGISMSVTAFPVLARILTDRQLQNTRMGTVALTCAAVADVSAWCLLAFVVGVIQSRLMGAGWTLLLTGIYVAVMLVLVRPMFTRLFARWERRPEIDQSVMAGILLALLLSSLATEYTGIHSLFGAFLFGAILPHGSSISRALRERLHDLVVILLLPVFFAFTGLRTHIGLIQGSQWLVCGLITLFACVGKFGGSTVAALWTGMRWREAASLGILMNTRGLMELIVLNVGLDLGVISPQLFAMLVIMAIVTTFATTPALDALASCGRLE